VTSPYADRLNKRRVTLNLDVDIVEALQTVGRSNMSAIAGVTFRGAAQTGNGGGRLAKPALLRPQGPPFGPGGHRKRGKCRGLRSSRR
jgi:hypothetical protein